MQFTAYKTVQGDRWDTISYKAYGNVEHIHDLIEANPGIPIDTVLSPGITLKVPILELATVTSEKLPPWKQ